MRSCAHCQRAHPQFHCPAGPAGGQLGSCGTAAKVWLCCPRPHCTVSRFGERRLYPFMMAGKRCCVGSGPECPRTNMFRQCAPTAPPCRTPNLKKRQKVTRSMPGCKRSGTCGVGLLMGSSKDLLCPGTDSIIRDMQAPSHAQWKKGRRRQICRRKGTQQTCNSLTAACRQVPPIQVQLACRLNLHGSCCMAAPSLPCCK